MKKIATLSASALLALTAGQALGQITVDGRIAGPEAALYGPARWVQNVPTGFGDNAPPPGGCNESDIGNPAAVTTGIEYRIPLSSIGSPTGNIRLVAVLANGGHSSLTNQILPAIPGPGAAPLGVSRTVDLNNYAGNQFATVSASSGDLPAVDGTLDAAYGAALAVQGSRSSAGDDTDASASTATGSELNAMYAVVRGDSLYIMLTGNLKSDFGSKIELFIDNGDANGFNSFPEGTVLPDVDFNALQNMIGNANGAGLRFDVGFKATHYFTFGAGNDPVQYYPNIADLVGGFGQFLGCNDAGNGSGILAGCGGATEIEIAVNNANTEGVGAICPPANGDPDRAGGSEIDNLHAYIADGQLHLLIGGNLQNSFNKLDLFFDVASGGQNVLLNTNVDIDFNGLNNMSGLTFDEGFAADYWFGFTNGNDPVEMYGNAAVLRTDGPRTDFNFNKLDYGAYDGGLKSQNNPLDFNGPQINIQDGFTANIFTNFAPRLSGDSLLVDPFNPVGATNQIQATIDNSNLLGVTDSSASPVLAAQVTTGFELRFDLDELGWDGSSPIRIAGFINNGGHTFLSNQVLGGLPEGSGNLGAPAGVNFANIAGNQYIDLTSCPADFNGDNFLDFFDYDDYVNCFETGTCPDGRTADFNGDDFVDFFDYDAFVAAFETGC
ncbi:MAG: hypothetical protein HEQ23_00285 [Tepidisphaera sp.]